MNRILWFLVTVFVIAGFGFFIADMTGGREGGTVAVITGVYYVPEQTTVMVDSEGHTTIATSPEEFHVLSADIETGEGFDIQVSGQYSAGVTNGQVVSVRWVVGRWTGWRRLRCYGD